MSCKYCSAIGDEKSFLDRPEMWLSSTEWGKEVEKMEQKENMAREEVPEIIDKEIDKIINESKEEEKKIRDFFSDDNNKNSLATNLLNDKLFTHINEFAIIMDKEKSTSDLRKQT